ncbi:MAG: WD40 repeat domain-containing protein [Thermoanaerobaculia bacterium]|nr:WD40 repeat domain-containing protein [Thermoanaerobaculia bacterium]
MSQPLAASARSITGLVLLILTPLALAQGPVLRARVHRSFAPHEGVLREVAFSPDSQTLATSGAVDRTVKLWRIADGKLQRTLTHPEGVASIAFSRDGQWLVSGSYDHAVRIWRLRDGALVRTLKGHGGTVWSVAISPDGQRIASGGEDKTVRMWRASDGGALHVMTGHTLNVWAVGFSPDGLHVGSSSFDKTVKIWRTGTGALVRTLSGHEEAVVSMAFSPKGDLIASSGDDSTVRLWRVKDGAQVAKMTGGSDHIYSVAFSPDGQWLASGGREKGALGTLWKQIAGRRLISRSPTIRLWRVRDGKLIQALDDHTNDVWSVAFSPDGKWLASSSEDGSVKLWRLQ